MHASIVLPLDGSAFGTRAPPLALALARRDSTIVHLAHVHVPIGYAGDPPIVDSAPFDELRR